MHCRRRYIFLLLLLTCCTIARGQQKEANTWYFGRYLGLDFNSGAPVALNDGQLNTTEGVATISNSGGSLLFYTDGSRIWNRFHQVMPNGTGLFGSFTSSQSAIIVPKIGDTTRYFVFTVDAESGPRGLNYSVVNMTLDNGRGDVETKNIPLQLNVVEKITAVRHCNNRDIWVVAHGSMSDIYYSFLVTPAGVNTTPVISHTGVILPGPVPPSSVDSSSLGYLKASPDGKRIAAAHWTVNADISDFDNATGIVSNTYSLFVPTDPHYLVYGIEFSPNSNLVYNTVFYTDPVNAQKRNALFQYDVSLATPAAVRASKQVISLNSDPIQIYAALQIAPDGKMYMAKNIYNHIASINNPNVYGAGCNFVSNAIQYTLPTQQSSFGLPTFIQSYFYPVDSFTYTINCPGATASFNYIPQQNVTSVLWNFNDPASGVNNTSTLNNPVHTFSAAGSYNVMLIKFTNCGPDTLRRTIVADTLNINLGPDTTVCGGNSVLLNAGATGSSNVFLWQDGTTNPTYTATVAGLYWVEVKNNLGCVKRDSINVSFKPIPSFSLGADTSLCQQEILVLTAGVSNPTSFLWNTGATTSSINATQAGVYWCEVNKDGCRFRDSLSILSIKPSPVVNLGNDLTLCEGITATLDATFAGASYLWQNGSANPIFTVSQAGTYYVSVDLNGCKKSDTVLVNYNPKPKFSLGPDQFICTSNSITLSPVVNSSWQLSWQNGSAAPTFIVTQPGTYSLTATNNCGSATDEVIFSKGVCKVFVPTGFTPNNDGLNDFFKALGTETVTQYDLKIFNRWGEIVFQTKDKSRGWDGKVGGVTLSSAVFIYLLQYTDINSSQPQVQKGTFLLIR